VLPLLQELAKDAMRPRHWEEISVLTSTEFDMEKFAELKVFFRIFFHFKSTLLRHPFCTLFALVTPL
jgi:hypothetical protein